MQPNPNKYLYPIIILFFLGLGSVSAILIYYRLNPKLSVSSTTTNNDNSFFSTINASVTGEITSITGETLTIKNKQGSLRAFKVAQTASLISTSGDPLSKAELNKLETNKEMVFNFITNNGEIVVSSVFPFLANPILKTTALPPSPPPAPPKPPLLATSSGKPVP